MLQAIQELEWPQVSQKGYPQVRRRCSHRTFQSCHWHVFLKEPALDDHSLSPRAKSLWRCTYILKVRRFHINIPIKSIVIMGWQCCFFICRLSPGGRVTHQKLYFWYEDSGRRRSEKEHFPVLSILYWYIFGFVLWDICFWASLIIRTFRWHRRERTREIGAVYDILALYDMGIPCPRALAFVSKHSVLGIWLLESWRRW